jgi:hypothetical protein
MGFDEGPELLAIRLVGDEGLDALAVERRAVGDVDAVDPGLGKIVLPQAERAAIGDPDLEDPDRLVSERRKHVLVDLGEVVSREALVGPAAGESGHVSERGSRGGAIDRPRSVPSRAGHDEGEDEQQGTGPRPKASHHGTSSGSIPALGDSR